MATHIGSIKAPRGANRQKKRIGFGIGSGHGKTATRGAKGQRSRAGSRMRPGFEGGQMPLQRRLPKRGFTNIFRKQFTVLNVGDLAEFPAGQPITPWVLLEAGLIRKLGDGLKILGEGDVKAPLHISAHHFSKTAIAKIEAAGGRAEVIPA